MHTLSKSRALIRHVSHMRAKVVSCRMAVVNQKKHAQECERVQLATFSCKYWMGSAQFMCMVTGQRA